MKKFRTEKDSLGSVKVPSKSYYGAQTQRAIQNFEIGWPMDFNLVLPLIVIKKAAAISNAKQKRLSKKISNAIIKTCDAILKKPEDFIDEFPLSVFQSGSGTQTNMNVNEVIANKANELLGGKLGQYKFVHPNDHVNMSQSTNDTFPTAILIGSVINVENNLLPSLDLLKTALKDKEKEFKSIVKVGRTHLQDATPITLGQEFSGYASMIAHDIKRIEETLKECSYLPIGGTAVGTGINTIHGYDKLMVKAISDETGFDFKVCANKFELLSSQNAISDLSSRIKICSGSLNKIANDIKWLASGPMAGIGELRLPSNEPGSSIMPGKVNPTQCEALTMVCVQVMGNSVAVSIGGATGHFELNVFKPVIAANNLQSLRLLGDAARSFADRCVTGIEPNIRRITELMESSLMLVTALNPHIGYDNAAKIAKNAHEKSITLKESALQLNLMTEQQYDEWVRPNEMV